MDRLPLICICEEGFYPIDPAPPEWTEEKWAEENGKLNAHIKRIETMEGKTLWTRIN